jgi:hypothetical protein
VHLAYLDDSQQREPSIAMFGSVVMPHGVFGWAERFHSIAIEQLFPADEIEERFQEFHAADLFHGEGAFKGIDEDKRFDAITVLLMTMKQYQIPFIYAAINEKKLEKSPLSQGLLEIAHPLVPAFKLCALGIEMWAKKLHGNNSVVDYSDQYMLIVDETKDQELKKRLRRSYRLLRTARPYIANSVNRLWYAHDAMYFGDSRDSVGIQLADLCTYFMQRHLSNPNPNAEDDGESFYKMFASQAICAAPEPEWSQYRELLLSHEVA